MSLEEALERLRALRYLLPALDGYMDHQEGCSALLGPSGGIGCDCGLERRLRRAYGLLEGIPAPQGTGRSPEAPGVDPSKSVVPGTGNPE